MMKLFLQVLVLVFATSFSSHAQSLRFADTPPDVISGMPTADELKTNYLTVTNTSSKSINVKVRMVNETPEMESIPYFCWTLCYPPHITESPESIQIGPGESNSSFAAYIIPNSIVGQTKLKFEFYDEQNPEDKLVYRVTFNTDGTVSVRNVTQAKAAVSVSPLPVRDIARFDYTLPTTARAAELTIYNLVGNPVATYRLADKSGVVAVDMARFSPGMYFYSITADGQRIASKKFVIER